MNPYVGDFCVGCAYNDRRHLPGCPILALPRIVAALEAAERMTGPLAPVIVGSDAVGRYCTECDETSDFADPPAHADDCPWQALAAALEGDEVVPPQQALTPTTP